MKPKAIVKIITDVLMTIALFFLSGYQLWGEQAHEWVGTGMLVLFIAHHILNANWYKNIGKGKYTPMRVMQLCVDAAVLLTMLMLMYSGIAMSNYVFAFLPFNAPMALARKLHILGAYWGFLLMNLHLGLHWNMLTGIARRIFGVRKASRLRTILSTTAGALLAGYGVFVFFKREFFIYLFLETEFVFLNYGESPFAFYADYIALAGLCIFIAHYAARLCVQLTKRKR